MPQNTANDPPIFHGSQYYQSMTFHKEGGYPALTPGMEYHIKLRLAGGGIAMCGGGAGWGSVYLALVYTARVALTVGSDMSGHVPHTRMQHRPACHRRTHADTSDRVVDSALYLHQGGLSVWL
jgi:hypothetical protein